MPANQNIGAGQGVHTPLLRGQARSGASSGRAFVLLAKAFIGSGMLFLPRAFSNGGLLFSTLTLLLVAAASLHTMQQLRAGGRWLRRAVDASIFASQLGFACAGSVFVAATLRDAFNATTACRWHARLPLGLWITGQTALLAPLCLVRHIRGFSRVALLADSAILLGLAFILATSARSLSLRGPGPHVILTLNTSAFSLFLGSAAYTFEGYALILPICSAMRRPQAFPRLLALVMVLCAAVAVATGGLCYLAFGSATAPIALLNMPAYSPWTQTVRALYALAIIGTTPLMLFPAYRLIEQPRSSGGSSEQNCTPEFKTAKNALRLAVLGAVMLAAHVGARRLDRLVAVVGGAACVPLAFVYPPLIHLRLGGREARGWWRRARDVAVAGAGVLLSAYVTAGAVGRWGVAETPYDFCLAEGVPPKP
ncbi:hypothetical protein GGI15_002347 [Coemansia interrupta]|uniref:Amino acid transporter transmembrane domain-containing protein n=1 Tax=Coemansia interrupta TaxID=1126814 RepID=A0A9W8HIJ9_9FUNG|nr:hypothetical protein GGI15_002347 [Coemansia interrupta]